MLTLNEMFLAILPELSIFTLAGIVLFQGIFFRNKDKRWAGWITFGGLLVIMLLSLTLVPMPQKSMLIFGQMLRVDMVSWGLTPVLITGAALTVLLSLVNKDLYTNEEYFVLLLFSLIGMILMVSASDIIMLYLAIETTSLPLFVLAGFVVNDQKSVEAGIKYLLFAAVTSAIMLYGFSLLYGFTGSTQLDEIAVLLQQNAVPLSAVALSLIMVLVGFFFKISAVPFQFWAPDVYEGAPAPVTGFLSTASKLAGFVVLMRVVYTVFSLNTVAWAPLIMAASLGSMIVGNLLAIPQKNIKRLLAYSSIAQAGYMLIGVSTGTVNGVSASLYYLMAYLVTNLAAFGVVVLISRALGSSEISAFAGLSRRSPYLALMMLVSLLSLAGIPPFAGFAGKLLVFSSGIEQNLVWLVFIAIINTIIGLYYYLSVLKVIYLYHSEGEDQPLKANPYGLAALIVCVIAILLMGVWIGPGYTLSHQMALNLLGLP